MATGFRTTGSRLRVVIGGRLFLKFSGSIFGGLACNSTDNRPVIFEGSLLFWFTVDLGRVVYQLSVIRRVVSARIPVRLFYRIDSERLNIQALVLKPI